MFISYLMANSGDTWHKNDRLRQFVAHWSIDFCFTPLSQQHGMVLGLMAPTLGTLQLSLAAALSERLVTHNHQLHKVNDTFPHHVSTFHHISLFWWRRLCKILRAACVHLLSRWRLQKTKHSNVAAGLSPAHLRSSPGAWNNCPRPGPQRSCSHHAIGSWPCRLGMHENGPHPWSHETDYSTTSHKGNIQ